MTIEMEELLCATCGVAYCVPRPYFEAKAKNEQEIYCPNGHSALCQVEGGESEQVKELRRQYALAIHQNDQAAARAAAGGQDAPPTPETPKIVTAEEGRLLCPHCSATFKMGARKGSGWSMKKHLWREHGVALDDAGDQVERALRSFVAAATRKEGKQP